MTEAQATAGLPARPQRERGRTDSPPVSCATEAKKASVYLIHRTKAGMPAFAMLCGAFFYLKGSFDYGRRTQ